jgi:hypothetical protein
MALAILRLDEDPGDPSGDGVPAGHGLVVDTGTSTHYRIHLGKEVRREDGFTLLDGPYWSSPLRVNPRAGRHVDTRIRTVLDAALVTEPGTLVQLETCRGSDGHGPAWSRPLGLPGFVPTRLPAGGPMTSARTATYPPVSMAASTSVVRTVSPLAPRMVPVSSAMDVFSRPASIGDLIAQVVQAAAPIALKLLDQNTPAPGTPAATADPTGSVLTDLLRTVLGALARTPAGAAAVTPPAPVPPPAADAKNPPADPKPPAGATSAGATSAPASVAVRPVENRFWPYSGPMIFGIDDALIGTLAGPIISNVVGPFVQALPQLLNAVNQQKLARRALTDQQVKDLLSQVDRTMLMQQLISAQNQPVNPGVTPAAPADAAPTITPATLDALTALLAATPTAAAPTGTPAAAISKPASIDAPARPTPVASKAVLSMVTGPATTWLGSPQVVFSRAQAPTFRFRLDVGTGGPTSPLPRAILELCIREPGGAHTLVHRSERLTGIVPGTLVTVTLTSQEATALPADSPLEVLACLRWRGSRSTYQATSAQPIVMGSAVLVRDRGDIVGDQVELADMGRFRAFWNKVWASATPDASKMWGLDVAMRYSVVTTTSDRGNGLMEAKLQQPPGGQPDDQLRVTTSGRLKSGLEVSIAELNKLLPLWPGEQPLAADELAAFGATGWLAGTGGDLVTQVKLDGKRGTSGQLWVVPVPRLRAHTLSRIADVDPSGQVVSTTDRTVHFPVVESVRVLGLCSRKDDGDPDDTADGERGAATYRFDGYDVVLNQLVGLEPARPLPKAGG